jgi:hypothetical protein
MGGQALQIRSVSAYLRRPMRGTRRAPSRSSNQTHLRPAASYRPTGAEDTGEDSGMARRSLPKIIRIKPYRNPGSKGPNAPVGKKRGSPRKAPPIIRSATFYYGYPNLSFRTSFPSIYRSTAGSDPFARSRSRYHRSGRSRAAGGCQRYS